MRRTKQLAEQLGEVPLFSRCSPADLRTVARHLEVVELDADTTVVTEGEPGETFYLVLDGTVVVERGGEVAGELSAPTHFGELALLDPAPRAATIRTATACTVGALSVRMFRVIVRDLPTVSFGLLASLAGQLRKAADPA